MSRPRGGSLPVGAHNTPWQSKRLPASPPTSLAGSVTVSPSPQGVDCSFMGAYTRTLLPRCHPQRHLSSPAPFCSDTTCSCCPTAPTHSTPPPHTHYTTCPHPAPCPAHTPPAPAAPLHPPPTHTQVESILNKKKAAGLDASITNYPKQAHGFSLRGNSADASVAQAATTAFDAGRAFLDKHLK